MFLSIQSIPDQLEQFTKQDDLYSDNYQLQIREDTPQEEKKIIQKQDSFDTDKFIKSLDDITCFKKGANYTSRGSDYLKLTYCLSKLESYFFDPIINIDGDPIKQSMKLDKLLYQPLANNSRYSSSFAQNLLNLLFDKDNSQIVKFIDYEVNYNEFQSHIMKSFNLGQQSLQKKNWTKDVSQIWTDIMKRFHVYWNALRSNQQMERLQADTKKIMTSILNQYSQKENFFFEVTKTLVQLIKQGYQKFIIAHQIQELVKKEGQQMFARLIVKTYEEFVEDLDQEYYDKKVNEAISRILDLNLCFMMVYYKQQQVNFDEEDSFNDQIIDAIEASYEKMMLEFSVKTDEVNFIKDFTVIIMLKLKHQFFIYHKYHSKDEFQHSSEGLVRPSKNLTVKLYYELMDNLVNLLPKCENEINLRNCVYMQLKQIFTYLSNKYQLKNSYTGIHTYFYLQRFFQYLMSEFSDKDFDDIRKFQSYFYPRVFNSLFNFKKRFQINDEGSLNKMEKDIGALIDSYKIRQDVTLASIRYQILDQLDIDFYDKFLDVKAQMDQYAPIGNDRLAILEVEKLLKNFLKVFRESFQKSIDPEFEQIFIKINHIIEEWKDDATARIGSINTDLNQPLLEKYEKEFELARGLDFQQTNADNDNKLVLGPHENIDEKLKEQEDRSKLQAQLEEDNRKQIDIDRNKKLQQSRDNEEEREKRESFTQELIQQNRSQDNLPEFMKPKKKITPTFKTMVYNDKYGHSNTTLDHQLDQSTIFNNDPFNDYTNQNNTVIMSNNIMEPGVKEGLVTDRGSFLEKSDDRIQ